MKKFALGIHHLNIAYTAGNEPSYHRLVREGISPLLDLLFNHPGWCFTIEMSGFSVEFLARHYPAELERIRQLIKNGQIEFVSCCYSPQIWIDFPKRDMVKSIEINLEVLKQHSITPSRIFFSQENFSGEGIKNLKAWFDIAIVKDDYLFYLYDKPQDLSGILPFQKLGDIDVLLGWGHILEGIVGDLFKKEGQSTTSAQAHFMRKKYEPVLNQAYQHLVNKNKLGSHSAQWNNIEWTWYHIGSSERFAKAYKTPQFLHQYKFDPHWYSFVEQHLVNYEKEGYRFTSIQEFVREIYAQEFKPSPCKFLLDGSWNMEESKGTYLWSGYNSSVHEDDLAVRNHNWRSRAKLLALECLLEIAPVKISPEIKAEIEKIWKYQLLAEVSDATGWFPDKGEVMFSLQQSENVLNTVSKISSTIKMRMSSGMLTVDTSERNLITANNNAASHLVHIKPEDAFEKIELFGSTGSIDFYSIDDNRQSVFINLLPCEEICGVTFPFHIDHLIFSPALMDEECVSCPLDDLKPVRLYLFLPNGLICIKKDTYLIKHNETLSIACCIDKSAKTGSFKITNPKKQALSWEITLYQGNLKEAIALANRINISPIVSL